MVDAHRRIEVLRGQCHALIADENAALPGDQPRHLVAPLAAERAAVLRRHDCACTEPLSNADKELDSPYNTYKVAALPPGPISSVGEASLRAAVAPAAVPFKFYVLSDASGKHAFAETQEQHDANVQAAREKGLL